MILHYSSNKAIHELFQYLSDMQKFTDVHPVIYKAELIGENEYLIYEKLKFLMIPFKFTYKAILKNVELDKTVSMYSEVQKGVHLNLRFDFKTLNQKTEITETVEIKANPITKLILGNTIKRAHRKLFENIEKK